MWPPRRDAGAFIDLGGTAAEGAAAGGVLQLPERPHPSCDLVAELNALADPRITIRGLPALVAHLLDPARAVPFARGFRDRPAEFKARRDFASDHVSAPL